MPEHMGIPANRITVEIADHCPKCGAKRGVVRGRGFSYDGSRRLEVDVWQNECRHIDKYSDVRLEALSRAAALQDG